MQLGPPSADERAIYAQSGLGSLAAINAFTGEVVWLSGYPRVHINHWDYGTSGEWRSYIRPRVLKLLARGPVSPIVMNDTIVMAPKDAPGLIGFDRKTGKVLWQDELLDCPYLAGVCGNNILTIGNTVRAIQASNGATAWEYSLSSESVYGQPGYSGETIYLPTDERLHLIDARTGKLLGAYPWDPRV
jgi:outer membrane protein assembly factor BamB